MQPAYRGGRRGGRPFRGRGRGYQSSMTASHRRGHGHGGGRHIPHGAESASLNSVVVPTNSSAVSMLPSALVPGQTQVSGHGNSAPPRLHPRMVWCELCRVDCNTPEILEQHKNGKRHKKNLRLHEELQKLNKVKTGEQNVQIPNSESEVIQVQKIESEGKETKEDSLVPSVVNDEKSKEILPEADANDNLKASVPNPAELKGKSRDRIGVSGRGSKRNLRGGRGGKYMRTNEGRRRPVEPPKPKEVIPFICELCNVKCESQVVFNTHLAGKKHIANLKRFHGHRELYGEAGVQELYPPNLGVSSSSYVPPVQQGVADPQIVLAQLLNYVLCQAQAQGQGREQVLPGLLAPLVAGVTASLAPGQAPLLGLETQDPHNQQARSKDVILSESECAQQPVASKFESLSKAEIDYENVTSESLRSKNPTVSDELALSATGLDNNVCPEIALSMDQVVKSGSNSNIKKPADNPEENAEKENEGLAQ